MDAAVDVVQSQNYFSVDAILAEQEVGAWCDVTIRDLLIRG
jgi:hypothetical protein